MKIKLTYSEVKQALKSGFVSPLNSAKKTVNFIGKCFYKLDVFSDDDAVDTTKIFEVIDQGPSRVRFGDGSTASIVDDQLKYCVML